MKIHASVMANESLSKFLILAVILRQGLSDQYRRVCYHTNWAQYRPSPAKYVPEDIPVHLCTHLVYAFATMKGNRLAPYEWNDDSTEWMTGMYKKFTNLKNQNPNLKMLLGVGGWNFGTKKMTKMLATRTNRKEFIETSIRFLRKRDFDGLDLDFEYPASRGSPADDKWRYAMLVKEMSAALDKESYSSQKPRLLLTAAVAAGKTKIDAGYDVPTLARHLDFINLMSYDFHGQWESKTGHNSPLYGHEHETGGERHLNLAFAATYWVDLGTPADKINVGLPLYGRTFTLKDSAEHGIGAPAKSGGNPGKYTKEKGYLSYYEVCDFLDQGATLYWFEEQQVPYAAYGDQWLAFDNEDSLEIKVQWIKERGFGGVMVWALDLDDSMGVCGREEYPLMTTIVESLEGSRTGSLPLYTVKKTGHLTANNLTSSSSLHNGVGSHDDSRHHQGVRIDCIGKDTQTFPHAEDCTQYHQCIGDQVHTFVCPPGTRYDAELKVCSVLGDHNRCHNINNNFKDKNSNVFQPPVDPNLYLDEISSDDLFNLIPQITPDGINPFMLPLIFPDDDETLNTVEDGYRTPSAYKESTKDSMEEKLVPEPEILGYMSVPMLHPYVTPKEQTQSQSQNLTFMDQLFLYYLVNNGAEPVT